MAFLCCGAELGTRGIGLDGPAIPSRRSWLLVRGVDGQDGRALGLASPFSAAVAQCRSLDMLSLRFSFLAGDGRGQSADIDLVMVWRLAVLCRCAVAGLVECPAVFGDTV